MSMDTMIVPAEAAQKTGEAESLAESYQSYEIVTTESYGAAGGDLKVIKAKHKELDALRKSMTKPIDESKKRIMELFREPLARLKEAEGIVSTAMVDWHQKQERLRRLEEERLRELQRKEAARLAKLAANAEKRGDTKKAAEFDNRVEEVSFAAPVIPPKTTKIAGLAVTKIWKYRIVDLSKLPREYMIPNEKMLGQMARTGKGFIPVAGVEFYSEDSVRGTR